MIFGASSDGSGPRRASLPRGAYTRTPAQMMHRCPTCSRPRICMLECRKAGRDAFYVHVICPDCLQHHDGLITEDQVVGLSEAMEDGFAQLQRLADTLRAAWHEDEVQQLRNLLDAGALTASDF